MGTRLSTLCQRLGLATAESLERVEHRLSDAAKTLGQATKKIDRLNEAVSAQVLLIRRLEALLAAAPVARQGRTRRATGVAWPALPLSEPPGLGWLTLDACACCGHGASTLVCEYNRFLLRTTAIDGEPELYNYALCHGCGVVFARRRPGGARFRMLMERFNESLGRATATNPLLYPAPLDAVRRADLDQRAQAGVLVSEHLGMSRKAWLPGALRDRQANAVHVELIGSLLELRAPRVLEIRSRTGAILQGLRRLYQADVSSIAIFESQGRIAESLYAIPVLGLIDFEHFSIPGDGVFDLVISNHMITHAVAPSAFLQAIASRLAPGGHLYLYNEPDDGEFLSLQQSMFAVLNPFHLQTFDRESLVRLLAANGFETAFVSHTDQNFVCLARRSAEIRMLPMTAANLEERLQAYRVARDASILRLPEEARGRFAAEWSAVVERAVVAGNASVDERGRVIVGRRLAVARNRSVDRTHEHV